MKKLFLSIALLTSTLAISQTDLTLFGGYQFGSRTYTYDGTLRLKGSSDFGAMLEIGVTPDVMVQLSYTGAKSYATLERNVVSQREDLMVNYYQIGVIRPVPINDAVEVFGNFSMGATQFHFTDDLYYDEWRFSVTLGLGTKIWLSDVVGIRLHARMLAPINWAGLGFFCGTGGCGTSVNAGSTLISGDIGGGLVFRLKP